MIKIDSRDVKRGDTFVAIVGVDNDGHDYIEEAIKKGASLIVAERGLYEVDTLIVPNTTEYLNEYLNKEYSYLFKKLKLIGVTGTNGKTTTSYLMSQALNLAGIKSAYIGTIGFYIDIKIKELNNTTPPLYDIYGLLKEAYDNNCEYVVMEVSSHALDMGRVYGLVFDYVIFTNLTQDHLDYHKTMENYLKAKQKLFYQLKEDSWSIVNGDDKYSDNFKIVKNTITYGFSNTDYTITDVSFTFDTTTFKLNNKLYKTQLIGKFNVYNLVNVIIVLSLLKINNINTVVEKLTPPQGRLDIINYNTNKVIIDYAHTPDAVLKTIETVRELKPTKIITIVGCGGNRDKTKRPLMGSVACENSDYVFFTSDNPRQENPKTIIDDMIQIVDTNNYKIIIEREESINKGIQMLSNNDILLILGKGHENYQIVGLVKKPHDDKKIVLNLIGR